jgi:Rrf2 family protein
MNSNQQFAIACHILAVLAAYPDRCVTSEIIAESVDTNPVFIRRIMAQLRQRRFVDSRPGTSGGWRLLRPAPQISLREVYLATNHESALALHRHPNLDCPIGGNIQVVLGSIFSDAQTALEATLDRFSVADVLANTIQVNIFSGEL